MAIRIEKSFTVDAPPSAVWAFLTDPERVARCLPGTSITEQVDDTTFKGKTSLQVGPVAATYRGKMTFVDLDEAAGTAEMKATGQDTAGRGGADMRMSSRVEARDGGGTEVTVVSDVNVTGLLAQMGRGMIQDVSDELFEHFTTAMRDELEGDGGGAEAGGDDADGGTESAGGGAADAEPSVDAVAFGAKVARRTARRVVRQPAFWITVTLLVLIVLWFLLR